jgi:tRNA(fMet)-specific endonuclease VapC
MTYFLDTNICIRILNGSSQNVICKFEEIELDDIIIPSVVAAELIYGAYKSAKRDYNLIRFRSFLQQFKMACINSTVIETYGDIRYELERKGMPIGANDYFIAAIAKANKGILVTNNTREFSYVNGLILEDWTK